MRRIHDDRLSFNVPPVHRGLAWLKFKMRGFRFFLCRLDRLAPALLLRLAIGRLFTVWVRDAKVCLLGRWPHNNHLARLILLLDLSLLSKSFWFLVLLGDRLAEHVLFIAVEE